ncbi:hypothetical protein [Micromonospora sp. NPDC048169]|uniref:hypothetical protein n=1 Tax=Micromonospora sp. NPDC048169 TaxID=3154711 RepID=UPI0033C87FDA
MASRADDLNAAFTADRWLVQDLNQVWDQLGALLGIPAIEADWLVDWSAFDGLGLDYVLARAAHEMSSL